MGVTGKSGGRVILGFRNLNAGAYLRDYFPDLRQMI
jgi:hypothetical protein